MSITWACANNQLHLAKGLYYLRPTSISEWKSVDIFREACRKGHLSVAQWVYQINPSILEFHVRECFRVACGKGHLLIAQWLLTLALPLRHTIDDEMTKEDAFRYSCYKGRLHVAQWLYQINPNINISAKTEWAFRYACYQGHLPVVQWLLEVKPTLDIGAVKDEAFRMACFHEHLPVARFLAQLYPNKYILIQPRSWLSRSREIQYEIRCTSFVDKNTDTICGICCDHSCDVQLIACSHSFCKTCILHWLTLQSTCPICRHSL
jgi:hypothetical protein